MRCEPKLERLNEIYRRWSRAQEHPRQTFRRALSLHTVVGRIGYFVGAASSVLLVPFSQAVVPIGSDETILPRVTLLPFRPEALLALVLLWLVNAWSLDRHLAERTPREAVFKPWVLKLRFLLGGVPLLGRYVISAWRWLLDTKPPWASFESPARSPLPESVLVAPPEGGAPRHAPRLPRLRRLLDQTRRRLTSELSLGLLDLGNVIALFHLIYSETTLHPSPAQRWTVAGWAVLLHILAFFGMFLHLRDELRRAEVGFHPHLLFSLFWLVPVPYMPLAGMLGLVFLQFVIDFSPQEKTLIYRAYSKRGTTTSLPLWLSLEEELRRGWRAVSWWRRRGQPRPTLPHPAELSDTSDWLFRLYRGKSLLLAIDAMALAWIAKWFADQRPGVETAIDAGLEALMETSLVLCGLGLIAMVVYFIRLAARSPGLFGILDQHPYAQFLAVSQVSFFAGLAAGVELYESDIQEIALLLQSMGALCAAAAFVAFILRTFIPGGERIKRSDRHALLAIVGFSLMGLLGNILESNEKIGRGLMEWMKAFAITCPIWGVLLGRVHLRWLLRPFTFTHIRSSNLTLPIRWTLLFMSATLILPLGGLAIPLWIYIRHRKLPSWVESHFDEPDDHGSR